jgi:hypothetical protein
VRAAPSSQPAGIASVEGAVLRLTRPACTNVQSPRMQALHCLARRLCATRRSATGCTQLGSRSIQPGSSVHWMVATSLCTAASASSERPSLPAYHELAAAVACCLSGLLQRRARCVQPASQPATQAPA